MASRGGDPFFFDGFRTALARAPAGLLRPGPAATTQAISAAESRLGRPLPASYAAFLRSFDGAELFEESILLYGIGREVPRDLVTANESPRPPLCRDDEVLFGETSAGARLLLSSNDNVIRIPADSDERWLSGSTFPRWLDATIAHELMLYDAEGEFLLEAFEEDGEELNPTFALRQAERALRKDRGSAEWHHELGLAYRRIDRLQQARDAFAAAAALDPANPWPAFDEGRASLALDEPVAAADAFRRAAAAGGDESSRFLVWAARAHRDAGDEAAATAARTDAEARDPDIRTTLARSVEAATTGDDPDARAEAEALLAVFTPPVRRLPILGDSPRRR